MRGMKISTEGEDSQKKLSTIRMVEEGVVWK
jgi:hypothetical protein